MKSHNYLILDLDETLVFSSFAKTSEGIKLTNYKSDRDIYVTKRPFLDKFLKEMSKIYNLIVFTASEKKYADSVLKIIDP